MSYPTHTSTASETAKCPYCAGLHDAVCTLVKAIEYYPDGTRKRVEFHPPQPVVGNQWPPGTVVFSGTPPEWS